MNRKKRIVRQQFNLLQLDNNKCLIKLSHIKKNFLGVFS